MFGTRCAPGFVASEHSAAACTHVQYIMVVVAPGRSVGMMDAAMRVWLVAILYCGTVLGEATRRATGPSTASGVVHMVFDVRTGLPGSTRPQVHVRTARA